MTFSEVSLISHSRPVAASGIRVNKIIENLQVGSLVVECILGRPEGDGMNDDFFRDCGEGISHICFNVPDPEKVTADLLAKGAEIVMSLEQDGKIVENYLGTAKHGRIWLSLRPLPEKWHRDWQAHHRAHPLVSGWKFRGMAVSVKDLDQAVAYYQHLGIAEFKSEFVLDSSSPGFKVHGLTGSVARARVRNAMVGPVVYEFVQTLEKETTYGAFLSQRCDGACSLDFTVNDLTNETARLVYRGIQVVLSGRLNNGDAFACFDTRKVGNLMVKLVQESGK